jgi:surface antigen
MRVRTRIAGALLLVLGLSGCASSSYDADYSYGPAPAPVVASNLPATTGTSRVENAAGQKPLQCVPYAREHSQVKIFGDAWTWWDQASGKYERGPAPAHGTVMVLHNYAGPNHGHVAVVRRIVSSREIRIDHANWLNDGSIYVNNPVVDVSAANDWSQVRVFNIQTGAWGGKTYPVKGFIGQGSNQGSTRMPAPVETRKPLPQPKAEGAPDDALPIDALIAELSAPKPVRTAAARPAPVTTPRLQPVSATASDRNPPANSPFALTAEDLAIPSE